MRPVSGLSHCVRKARELLALQGIHTDMEKPLVNGVQASVSDGSRSCRVNYYWSEKKGFTLVPAGGDPGLGAKIGTILTGSTATGEATGLRIGTDEAGKGDWFGPLVAAGVACDDEACASLVSMGVADSKTLTNRRVLELTEALTVMDGLAWASRIVPPTEYNSLFSQFKAQGRNSLDIQAMAHGDVITELFRRTGAGSVVVDRFCPEKRLSPWLPAGNYTLYLRCRAEDDPVVAAASVIARGLYLMELDRLSLELPLRLTPGSGAPADQLGRELARIVGSDKLNRYAKEHFSNYARAVAP